MTPNLWYTAQTRYPSKDFSAYDRAYRLGVRFDLSPAQEMLLGMYPECVHKVDSVVEYHDIGTYEIKYRWVSSIYDNLTFEEISQETHVATVHNDPSTSTVSITYTTI